MDSILNPYSPGAGSPPPELAGRDALRDQVRVTIARRRAARSAKSTLMVGLRGVGKTVLLERMRLEAEAVGVVTVRMETPERQSLPALLAPRLRTALLKLPTGSSRTGRLQQRAEAQVYRHRGGAGP